MRIGVGCKKKVTIYDVAKLAKVSAATVSRVINKNYYVDPDTTARVEKAIRASGYYPDAIARTMRRNTSFSIGLIVSDLNNNHFTLIAKTIDQTIEEKNYNLIVCSSDGKKGSESRYLGTLMSKKVDGLIIHTSGENDDLITQLSHEVPIVLVYRKVESDNYGGDFVGTDDFTGAYRLAGHILSQGHRRIGLINGDFSLSTGRERFAGFKLAMDEAGVELSPELVISGSYHYEAGVAGAGKLLRLPERPTAVAAMSNALAAGALTCLRESGLAVPDDISFASFGEIGNSELLFVKPTRVCQHPERIGEIAADLILKRIEDPQRLPEMLQVNSNLELGNSVLCLNK